MRLPVRNPCSLHPRPANPHPQALRSLKKTRLEVEMLAEQLAQVSLRPAGLAWLS